MVPFKAFLTAESLWRTIKRGQSNATTKLDHHTIGSQQQHLHKGSLSKTVSRPISVGMVPVNVFLAAVSLWWTNEKGE